MSNGTGWRLAAALIALALGAGCDLLTAIGGGAGLRCRNDPSCPRNMMCSDGVCAAAGTDAAIDGSALDGSLRDRQASDVAFVDAARPDQLADIGHADAAAAADLPRADQPVSDLAAPDTRRPDTRPPDTAGTDRGPCNPDPCTGEFYCVVVGAGYECRCAGVVCNDTCYPAGECCGPSACGAGSWQCTSNQCICPSPYLDCSGNCRAGTTYYFDFDRDGYGDDGTSRVGCSAPNGYVSQRGDCDDGDGRVHPGQTQYFDIAAAGGGYDFNCDSSETKQYSATYSCVSCLPDIRATENQSRQCHRCSDTFSYCWVDYDVDPGPTCTDCCSSNSIYQLDCGCPVQASSSASCPINSCLAKRAVTGWSGSAPACGASGTWYAAGALSGTCVNNNPDCSEIATPSSMKQSCR